MAKMMEAKCPKCNTTLRLKPEWVGKSATCKSCGCRFVIAAPALPLPRPPRNPSLPTSNLAVNKPGDIEDDVLLTLADPQPTAPSPPRQVENPFAFLDATTNQNTVGSRTFRNRWPVNPNTPQALKVFGALLMWFHAAVGVLNVVGYVGWIVYVVNFLPLPFGASINHTSFLIVGFFVAVNTGVHLVMYRLGDALRHGMRNAVYGISIVGLILLAFALFLMTLERNPDDSWLYVVIPFCYAIVLCIPPAIIGFTRRQQLL